MSQTVYPTTACPQQRRNQNEVKIETSEDSSNTQTKFKLGERNEFLQVSYSIMHYYKSGLNCLLYSKYFFFINATKKHQ